MLRSDEHQVVGFEITEIPRSYINQSNQNEHTLTQSARVSNQQLGRFLNSTLYAIIKINFRIESDHGNCRYAYLLHDKDCKMFESRRTSWKSNPPSKDEIGFMKSQRPRGSSYGEIGEAIFDKYGYTLDPRDIRRILQKEISRKKNGEG